MIENQISLGSLTKTVVIRRRMTPELKLGQARRALAKRLLPAFLCMSMSFSVSTAQENATPSEEASSTDISATEQQADSSAETTEVEDPVQELQRKRDEVARQLQDVSHTIKLSEERKAELQQTVAKLQKTEVDLREALIESSARRKELEQQINDSEGKLARFGVREDQIRASFHKRRAILAEVLAALQRMGRNPPPALLVTPEDALASVRTAILLGAVVPGVRKETAKLAADLQELVKLRADTLAEKADLLTVMRDREEEERRTEMLLVENDKIARKNALELEAEQKRSDELASNATSMESLIASLESDIGSVREAMERARAEEERQKQLTEDQRRKAIEAAKNGMPDKNRIAPAYPFSELTGKLELPAAGQVIRTFGDPDGTGHTMKGWMIASAPDAIVTAPADGLVVFAGEFRSYGQMVILNPGDGYHIVMSGMDHINTRQGKFVLSGEPLGTMGAKRVASAAALALETDRPTLYIEFRKDGLPVDSATWWTAKDAGRAKNGT